MTMTINGSGTITGLSAGGLPSATITQTNIATPVGGTGPAFSAYQSSATSLSNNTYTKVLFANELYDTNNNFASSTFTPTVAGYYQINCSVQTNAGQTTRTRIVIYKNGSQFAAGTDINTGFTGGTASSIVYFNGSTDYVEVYIYQSSGTTQLTESSSFNTYFNGSMVRAA